MNAAPVAASDDAARRIDGVIRMTVWLVLVAAAIYLGLALWAGWRDLAGALRQLGLLALAGGVIASTLNYLLRFARWQRLLAAMSLRIPARASLPIYIGGLALTATPGKLGETVRSVLLLRLGVPAGASLAAFFIDRLSDLAGVFVLTAASGRNPWWLVGAAASFACGFALRWLMRHPRAVVWLTAHRGRMKLRRLLMLVDSGRMHFLAAWRPRHAAWYAFVAVAAYGLQAGVFALYVERLWPAIDALRAIHIFCVATLAGAASMIPGGLGAMELTLIALLVDEGVPSTLATAAAVAIRTVTLWFGILLGVTGLLMIRKPVR